MSDVAAAGVPGTWTPDGEVRPSAQELPEEVQRAVSAIPGVTRCAVDTVWDPPWDQSRMSEDARLALNMF